MRKILIFSTAYLPYIGGAELAVKEIADRLKDFEFDMLTIRFDSKLPVFEKVGNVNVYRLGFTVKSPSLEELSRFPLALNKYFFPFIAFFKALDLEKKRKYSAAWSIMASYSGFGALFFKYFKPNIPLLLTLQEGDPFEHIKARVGFLRPLYLQIFRKADHIQAISNYLADYGRQMGFRGDLSVVPNGVDLENFTAEVQADRLAELKKQLGKKDGEIFLATASRLVAKNGIGDVIRALPLLPVNVKFLIMGIGPEEEKLRALAEELNVAERAIFLGQINHQDLPAYLKASDIFIRPSLSEGLGSSFLEAMAAGLPVIATPVGGIPDFFVDLKQNSGQKPNGVYCEAGNPTDVAEKVMLLVQDANVRNQLAANGMELAMDKYGWDNIAGQMRDILNKL